MSEILQTAELSEARENPLLKPWETPFETPPFAEIEPEHFLPAFEQAFADHAAEIQAITHDPTLPDFANTITALERSGRLLSKVAAVFYDLVSAHSNPAILEIDKEVSVRMARHWLLRAQSMATRLVLVPRRSRVKSTPAFFRIEATRLLADPRVRRLTFRQPWEITHVS